uniref:hypothetical protein n=1 Tax=Prevotella sp. TaxID=59823 RepID=UPI003FEE5185
MTSLLLLILSIFIALGFARYNKSNKLFWIILVSLLLGFTGKSMVNSAFVDHKSEASTVKSYATPMLAPTCSLQALEPSEGAGTCDETKPAGKDKVVTDTVAELNLGEDGHIKVLTKPPQDWLKTNFIFDTS